MQQLTVATQRETPSSTRKQKQEQQLSHVPQSALDGPIPFFFFKLFSFKQSFHFLETAKSNYPNSYCTHLLIPDGSSLFPNEF